MIIQHLKTIGVAFWNSGITQIRGPGSLRPRFRTSLTLAKCLTTAKQFEEAERLLMELDRRTRNIRSFYMIDQYNVARGLAKLYEAWDKPVEAERWRQRTVELTSRR